MDNIIFKAIIDHAIDGIAITDEEGRIVLTNASLCKTFGYDADALNKLSLRALLGAKEQLIFKKCDEQGRMNSNSGLLEKAREVIGVKHDGSEFPIRLAISKVNTNDFKVFAAFIQDISAEKNAENELQRHADNLEDVVKERTDALKAMIGQLQLTQEETQRSLQKEKEIGQMKSRFVSMASHEFRSPLSRIQLSASLIERFYDRLDETKVMEHLQKIKHSVTELTNTLDDFLSVEKIDAGRIKPNITVFNLKLFMEDTCEEMSLLKRNGQEITCRHSGDTTVFILDKSILKHCLANLLSNACKYSDEGSLISVNTTVSLKEIVITVADTGIGIPEEQRKRLFEAFFRADNARDVPGTGLGLNIVKSYTELLGGKVSYLPVTPQGCEFSLIYPQPLSLNIPASKTISSD